MNRFLREPLVHFLLLGALLFVYFEWKGAAGPTSTRISVTPGLVQHLASGFARTWQRPPDERELKGLVDDYVKEEIAAREAMAMALDRDDTIIRRRLRQKLEFLIEDAVGMAAPTDEELQRWMNEHADAFRQEGRTALRQVYIDSDRRGQPARDHARQILARLRAAGPAADLDEFGDPTLLPRELPLGPASRVAREFGSDFADRVASIPAGEWSGPVESVYGLHLVLIPEREPASQPALEDVRPTVEREFLAERKREQLQAFYDGLLEKYTVDVEMPKEEGTSADGSVSAK